MKRGLYTARRIQKERKLKDEKYQSRGRGVEKRCSGLLGHVTKKKWCSRIVASDMWWKQISITLLFFFFLISFVVIFDYDDLR